ncbi:hypothetical protein ZOSMA_112G00330 [Zostera marina]|uniref:Uncharacterized protein n=1 Tax=Zostera marina TaxID=29655 RepID=A0A0K9Q2Z7_ZOSMR|nr:hypothetical protein ZOSMA_112G00330 [Zostera marina]
MVTTASHEASFSGNPCHTTSTSSLCPPGVKTDLLAPILLGIATGWFPIITIVAQGPFNVQPSRLQIQNNHAVWFAPSSPTHGIVISTKSSASICSSASSSLTIRFSTNCVSVSLMKDVSSTDTMLNSGVDDERRSKLAGFQSATAGSPECATI